MINGLKMFFVIAILFCAMYVSAQGLVLPPSGGNQKSSISQWMGPVQVTFTYNSPDVTGPNGDNRRGKIWGGLVPYGMNNLGFGTAEASPWRAGANQNTVFSTSHEILVEGKKLPAGKYGFFIVVEENKPWTIIFSSNSTSWGSYFYKPEEDVLRVEVYPEEADYSEWLNFGFENRQLNQCTAFLHWDEKRLPIKLEVENLPAVYHSIHKAQLRDATGFDWKNLTAAARYAVRNEIGLEQALEWSETAVTPGFIGQRNFQTLETKAMVLEAMGKTDEAEKIMQEAIRLPGATIQEIHFYGRRLLTEGKVDKAVEVFEYNKKAHPDDKFTTTVGLARGYAVQGNKKKAIKLWETALQNLPENQKQFLPQYQAEVDELKK